MSDHLFKYHGLFVNLFANSSWGLRTAEFAIYLFLVTLFPDTLLPASIYGFITTGVAILLSGWAGRLVDEYHNLSVVRASIIIIKLADCAQYGATLALLYAPGLTSELARPSWGRLHWRQECSLSLSLGAASTRSRAQPSR